MVVLSLTECDRFFRFYVLRTPTTTGKALSAIGEAERDIGAKFVDFRDKITTRVADPLHKSLQGDIKECEVVQAFEFVCDDWLCPFDVFSCFCHNPLDFSCTVGTSIRALFSSLSGHAFQASTSKLIPPWTP